MPQQTHRPEQSPLEGNTVLSDRPVLETKKVRQKKIPDAVLEGCARALYRALKGPGESSVGSYQFRGTTMLDGTYDLKKLAKVVLLASVKNEEEPRHVKPKPAAKPAQQKPTK